MVKFKRGCKQIERGSGVFELSMLLEQLHAGWAVLRGSGVSEARFMRQLRLVFRARNIRLGCGVVLCLAGWSVAGFGQASAAAAKAVGTVQSVSGNTITLKSDAGAEATVQVQDSTRMVRLAPGQKDLKDAAPVKLQDLQPGDRVLARGALASNGQSVMATSIIVMKGTDVAAKQEQEREDWQKRGVGGLVKAIDAAGGRITIS